MIVVIPFDIDGELLIRYLLYLSSRVDSGVSVDALRLESGQMPSPAVPQILARAGIRWFEIDAAAEYVPTSNPLDQPVSKDFVWRGIDGTQIDTRVEYQEGLFEGTNFTAYGDPPGAANSMWYGELPALSGPLERPTKRNHSRLAAVLRHAEFLYTVSPSGQEGYPEHLIRSAWTTLFTDAAEPDEANDSALQETVSVIEDSIRASLSDLGSAIDTRGLKRPVLLVNNLSCYTNEVASVALAAGEMPVTAVGPEGELQPVQIQENASGTRCALFVAKNAPLHGYAVWDLGATLIPADPDDEVRVSATHLENNAVRVEFDVATGLILQIFDKDSERDLLHETYDVQRNGRRDLKLDLCANLLTISEPDSPQSQTPLLSLERVEVVESGPVRGSIRFTRALPGGKSKLSQEIRLTSGSARIDFVTELDWQDGNSVLTATFPLAINAFRYTVNTPFGHLERPVYRNEAYPVQANCYHKWADLSEGDYGAALLSSANCEYKINGSTMQLAFNAGPGMSSFTYSLLPHGGNFQEGEVVENGLALTAPPICAAITGNRQGSLPLQRSFFEVDNASVFIETIKRAETEEAIIVRLYEAYNTRGEVLLTTTLPVRKAWLCDLLENNITDIPIESGEILLPFHPFEIITIKFAL